MEEKGKIKGKGIKMGNKIKKEKGMGENGEKWKRKWGK